MAKAKPVDERIAEIEEKQKQLEAQKKTLIAQAKDKERKDRTRRLIQIGAIFDSMGINTVEQADKLKMCCIGDEMLWKSFILAACAKWPPDTLAGQALEIRHAEDANKEK